MEEFNDSSKSSSSSGSGKSAWRDLSSNMCRNATCWPVVIYVIFLIIALIGILFSSMETGAKAWVFFITLIWGLIWAAILWFFCKSGNHAIAWFLLLLPLAIALFWYISSWLASATTSAACVSRGVNMGKK